MVAAVFIVQADFSGTAFGGTPTWTDITTYVLTVDDPPIVINWGRQDEQSEAQPRTCSMTLDNSDGRFTPGLTTGPYGAAVDVGVRIRVSTTANAVTTVRFDGYVNDWDAGWDNGGPMAVCTVDASDIFAQMGELQPLRPLLIEEVLLDAPIAYYPLGEAMGATSFGDASPNKLPGAPLTNSKYGKAPAAAGVTPDAGLQLTGFGTAVSFTNTAVANAPQTVVQLPPAATPTTASFSLEAWFATTASPGVAEGLIVAGQPGSRGAYALITSGGTVTLIVKSGGAGLVTFTVNVADGVWHHLVGTYDGVTAKLYLDGALVSSNAITPPTFIPGTTWIAGALDTATLINGFTGSVAHVAIYASALSAARAAAHYTAGKTAFAGERTDVHAARLLSYRPNTGSALDAGKGTVGVHDTTGVALQQALQDTGDAEGGPVFADGQGRITLYNRARQYDPVVGLTLDNSLDQVTAALRFRRDTQDIVNDDTVSRPAGASQRVVNAASGSKYGTKAVTPTLIVNSDRDAADAAGWTVAVGKAVKTKSPQLAVDLLAEPSAAQAAAVLAAGMLTVVNITNLPTATSPAASVKAVIQGGVETIGVDDWDVGFYATALPPGTLRADAAPSANTKLDSGLVIPW